MKNNIKDIKVENRIIVISYENNYPEMLTFNKVNKEIVLNKLKEEKKYLLNERKKTYTEIISLTILNLASLTATILTYICQDSFVLKLFISIFTFYFSLLNSFMVLFIKFNYKNTKNLLKVLKENKLPNEEYFLDGDNIININYLYHKYRKNYHNIKKNKYKNNNKILEFKRK